jgi:hypothetical protein
MVRRCMAQKKKDGDGGEPAAPKRQVSALQLWLEEQWEGWLKSVGTILLFAIAYMLYRFDLVGEGLAGAAFVAAVIIGSLLSVALPAWPLVQTPLQRALFLTSMVLAAGATGYPSMRAAIPPQARGEVRLTAAQPSGSLHVDGDGPWELSVGGSFKQAGGEAEVGYTIKASGGGNSDEISGSINRKLLHFRSRKGGSSTSLQEQTESVHRLPTVRGGEISFTVDGVDDQLADGLHVEVRPSGPNPILFIVLGAVALLLALGLDARLTDAKGKVKSYLAVGVGICFVFAIFFPGEATPHSLVRPAVGELARALGLGGIGGWVLGALGRVMFGPKIKKAKR